MSLGGFYFLCLVYLNVNQRAAFLFSDEPKQRLIIIGGIAKNPDKPIPNDSVVHNPNMTLGGHFYPNINTFYYNIIYYIDV